MPKVTDLLKPLASEGHLIVRVQVSSLNGFDIAVANQKTLDRLASDVAAKRIHVPITVTFSLNQVPAAIAAFHADKLGKQSITL